MLLLLLVVLIIALLDGSPDNEESRAKHIEMLSGLRTKRAVRQCSN